MAFTLNNFVGFETGGKEEIDAESGTVTITAGGRTGAYHVNIAGATGNNFTINCFDFISDAGSKQAIGFWFRSNSTDTSAFPLLITAHEGSPICFHIQEHRQSSSTFKLRTLDANGDHSGTTTTVFNNGTWYFIEIYLDNADPGTVEIWVDGVQELDVSSKDFTTGGSFSKYVFRSASGFDQDFDDIYIASGLTATSELFGDFEVFMRQNVNTTATPDGGALGNAGTVAAVGTWDDAAETPLDATAGTNEVEYTADPSGGSVDSIAMDSGSDFDGDSNIKGIKGIWHLDRDGGGGTTHSVVLGNDGDGNSPPATTVALTTTPTDFFVLRTTDLPLVSASDLIRQGAWTGGAQDIHIYEQWATVAHVPTPPVGGANPKGPLGLPLHGSLGGPI